MRMQADSVSSAVVVSVVTSVVIPPVIVIGLSATTIATMAAIMHRNGDEAAAQARTAQEQQ